MAQNCKASSEAKDNRVDPVNILPKRIVANVWVKSNPFGGK